MQKERRQEERENEAGGAKSTQNREARGAVKNSDTWHKTREMIRRTLVWKGRGKKEKKQLVKKRKTIQQTQTAKK
jgi:hypothetical protein